MSDCLPWDIVVEILSRLPVKSLMCLKCVSKSFYHLISEDAHFKKKHLNQSNFETAIVYSFKDVISCNPSSLASDNGTVNEDVKRIDVPVFLFGYFYWERNISFSCDGLFCLGDDSDCVIWNPHTRESKRIPHCFYGEVALVNIRYGLAYDSVSDDYKVIGKINFRGSLYPPQFSIFSLKTCSPWRKIKDDFPCKYFEWEDIDAVVNGAFHWIANDSIDSPYVLISLDVANEKFNKFSLPSPLACRDPHMARRPISCVLRKKLCIFRWTPYGFDLWTMEEYGVLESLRKTLSVIAGTFASFSCCRPMYMFEDDTIIMHDEHNGRHEQISVYKDGGHVKRGIFQGAYISKVTIISPHMSTT